MPISLQINQAPNGNMVVVLANVKFKDLENLVHFIYNGEVKVKNTDLNGFLHAGELLQVEGLANCAATDVRFNFIFILPSLRCRLS